VGPLWNISFCDTLVGELTLPGNTARVHLVVPASLKTKVESSIFLSTGFFVVLHVSYFQVFILEITFILYNIVD